jgi:hypothetical protein
VPSRMNAPSRRLNGRNVVGILAMACFSSGMKERRRTTERAPDLTERRA